MTFIKLTRPDDLPRYVAVESIVSFTLNLLSKFTQVTTTNGQFDVKESVDEIRGMIE